MHEMTAKALLDRWENLPEVSARDCLSRQVLGHLTSRWGVMVMIVLMTGTHRFGALRRRIGTVSERMLTQSL